MAKPKTLKVRKFLNKPGYGGMAAISGQITEQGGTISITDCNRQISLDFDSYYEEGRANALHKLDLLIDTLTRARAIIDVPKKK